MFYAGLEQTTRRNDILDSLVGPVSDLVRPYQTWPIQQLSHHVRPGRTTLVRAVHECRLTDFKLEQRLFIAGSLPKSAILHSRSDLNSERERKGAKEQGGERKEKD